MTRGWLPALLGLLMLSAPGCAALSTFDSIARFDHLREGSVRITQGSKSGCGAVIGLDKVLTVLHVVQGGEPIYVSIVRRGGQRVEARVASVVPTTPEPYVVLELELDDGPLGSLFGFSGFSSERQLRLGVGSPREILTTRGYCPWRSGQLRPGDSGSPVLDDAGMLVGLVHGRRLFSNEPVYVSLRDARTHPAPPVRPQVPANAGVQSAGRLEGLSRLR